MSSKSLERIMIALSIQDLKKAEEGESTTMGDPGIYILGDLPKDGSSQEEPQLSIKSKTEGVERKHRAFAAHFLENGQKGDVAPYFATRKVLVSHQKGELQSPHFFDSKYADDDDTRVLITSINGELFAGIYYADESDELEVAKQRQQEQTEAGPLEESRVGTLYRLDDQLLDLAEQLNGVLIPVEEKIDENTSKSKLLLTLAKTVSIYDPQNGESNQIFHKPERERPKDEVFDEERGMREKFIAGASLRNETGWLTCLSDNLGLWYLLDKNGLIGRSPGPSSALKDEGELWLPSAAESMEMLEYQGEKYILFGLDFGEITVVKLGNIPKGGSQPTVNSTSDISTVFGLDNAQRVGGLRIGDSENYFQEMRFDRDNTIKGLKAIDHNGKKRIMFAYQNQLHTCDFEYLLSRKGKHEVVTFPRDIEAFDAHVYTPITQE